LQLWGIYFCNFVHFYYATNTIGKKGIKGFASDIKNAINLKIGVKGADKTTTQRLKTNLQLFAEKGTSSTLNLPPYIDNAGKFVNWTKQFEKVKVPLTTEQVDELVALAKKFGVKVEASASDLAGHTGKAGTNWGIPHIHIGEARVHIPVPKGYQLP